MPKMSIFLTIAAVFCLSSASLAESPRPGYHLLCEQPQIQDAGYVIKGLRTTDKTLTVEIIALNGWLGDKTVFNGPMFIKASKRGSGCEYRIVDNLASPKTTLRLRPKSTYDVLENLNGMNFERSKDDPTEVVDDYASLRCSVSTEIELPSCDPENDRKEP